VKVYLAGPINGCTDEQAKGWREEARELLEKSGHEVFDPMVRDYRGRELEPGIAAEIVEQDKNDIRACGGMLVYYERPSVGTSMEVFFADDEGKVVIVVDKSGKPLSPWLTYHSMAQVGSIESAVALFNEHEERMAAFNLAVLS
jgi:nucleoside 2-deoxyribosyltransferase